LCSINEYQSINQSIRQSNGFRVLRCRFLTSCLATIPGRVLDHSLHEEVEYFALTAGGRTSLEDRIRRECSRSVACTLRGELLHLFMLRTKNQSSIFVVLRLKFCSTISSAQLPFETLSPHACNSCPTHLFQPNSRLLPTKLETCLNLKLGMLAADACSIAGLLLVLCGNISLKAGNREPFSSVHY